MLSVGGARRCQPEGKHAQIKTCIHARNLHTQAGPLAVLSVGGAWRCQLWSTLAATAARGELRVEEIGDVLEGIALVAQTLTVRLQTEQQQQLHLQMQQQHLRMQQQQQQQRRRRQGRWQRRQPLQMQSPAQQQASVTPSVGEVGNRSPSASTAGTEGVTAGEASQLSALVQQLCEAIKHQV